MHTPVGRVPAGRRRQGLRTYCARCGNFQFGRGKWQV